MEGQRVTSLVVCSQLGLDASIHTALLVHWVRTPVIHTGLLHGVRTPVIHTGLLHSGADPEGVVWGGGGHSGFGSIC